MIRIFSLFAALSFFAAYSQAQETERVLGLIKCQVLDDIEKIRACTDKQLLEDLFSELRSQQEEVPKGIYIINYMIDSDGNQKVEKIIRLPRQVNEKEGIEVLKETFKKVMKKQEWMPIKEVKVDGMPTIRSAISTYLEIDTSEL